VWDLSVVRSDAGALEEQIQRDWRLGLPDVLGM